MRLTPPSAPAAPNIQREHHMTLAQALKTKKRLAQRISELDSKLNRSNSVLAGNIREAPSRDILADRDGLVAQLVRLKTAICIANIGIQEALIEQAELKSKVAVLKKLSTTHGLHRDHFR